MEARFKNEDNLMFVASRLALYVPNIEERNEFMRKLIMFIARYEITIKEGYIDDIPRDN